MHVEITRRPREDFELGAVALVSMDCSGSETIVSGGRKHKLLLGRRPQKRPALRRANAGTAEPNLRCVVASRAEHHSGVWQAEPMPVVSLEILHHGADKFVARARHHEADRKASGVRGRSYKIEAPERAERTAAL